MKKWKNWVFEPCQELSVSGSAPALTSSIPGIRPGLFLPGSPISGRGSVFTRYQEGERHATFLNALRVGTQQITSARRTDQTSQGGPPPMIRIDQTGLEYG
jgi:hypothetical protein